MKRINTFIIVLLSVCFTACKQPVPSGMEKAFGCAVGKTTLEEFCGLFPEDSYEWGLSWNSPGIEFMGIQPNEVLSVILKEGSYRGLMLVQMMTRLKSCYWPNKRNRKGDYLSMSEHGLSLLIITETVPRQSRGISNSIDCPKHAV